MSYDGDQMRALSYALRDTAGLKEALRQFNGNISKIETLADACDRLAEAIEKHNKLEQIKLGIAEPKKR